MKITTTKVIRELQDNYEWGHITPFEILLIQTTIKIIDKKLKEHKGISIRK